MKLFPGRSQVTMIRTANMVAFGIYKRAPAKAAPIDKPHRNRLLHGHGSVCDNVTPTDHGLASWRALRVLIVDHQQDPAGGFVRQMRHWGHATRMAHDGRAALIAAADQHPDVVLLDLELSSMDGCCVARQLRRDSPRGDCFIIALADWVDDERRRQCSEAGIDLLLVKPTDPSVLEVLLWLECVRLNRQRAAEAGNTPNLLVASTNRSKSC